MTDIEAIEALARAATPGPWHVRGARGRMERQEWRLVDRYDEAAKKDENIACVGYDPRNGLGETDAQFIAAANPQAILSLIAKLREMEEALKEGEKP